MDHLHKLQIELNQEQIQSNLLFFRDLISICKKSQIDKNMLLQVVEFGFKLNLDDEEFWANIYDSII